MLGFSPSSITTLPLQGEGRQLTHGPDLSTDLATCSPRVGGIQWVRLSRMLVPQQGLCAVWTGAPSIENI